MPLVFIVRGVSGSGKSTVAEILSQLPKTVVVSADNYFLDINGVYNFDASNLGQAHQYCFEMFKMELLSGNDVVVDNTNTTQAEMGKYLEYAEERGHGVISLVVENRHGNDSVHNVPLEVRKKQEARLLKSIKLI